MPLLLPWGEEELATESLPGYGDRFERPHYGYNAEQSSARGRAPVPVRRWYDPSMGAFGSRDSYLGDAGRPGLPQPLRLRRGQPGGGLRPDGARHRL